MPIRYGHYCRSNSEVHIGRIAYQSNQLEQQFVPVQTPDRIQVNTKDKKMCNAMKYVDVVLASGSIE